MGGEGAQGVYSWAWVTNKVRNVITVNQRKMVNMASFFHRI